MIQRTTIKEYEDAYAACKGKTVLVQIDACRREVFSYNGWFIFTEPSNRYFYKTKTVEKFLTKGEYN